MSNVLKPITRPIVFLLLLMAGQQATAQVSLKNNLLYDASLTPNIGAEVGIARRWTFDANFGLNPWTFNGNKKFRHWLLQPEMRYWFCQKFDGHFVGFHLMGGEFNMGGVKLPLGLVPDLRDHRYEGWYVGGGFVYGYQWPVSRHFSIEATVGFGYDYLQFRKYPCEHCGREIERDHSHYIGPTKVAVNVIYNINKGPARTQTAATDLALTPQEHDALFASGTSTPILSGYGQIADATLSPTAGQMVLSMAVNLDRLPLRRTQTVVLRPVLRSADGSQEVKFRPLLVNGRDQHVLHQRGTFNKSYPDAIEVERHNGREQTVSYLAQVPYEPWMDRYTLEVEEDHCGCGDPMADATTTISRNEKLNAADLVALASMKPKEEKLTRELHGTAYVTFVVNRWEVKPDYMNNPAELRKITDTLNIMVADRNITVEKVLIHGYASPESPYEHNDMLAINRAKSLTSWVQSLYNLPASVFAPAEATPENWEGLRKAVEETSTAILPHRAEILALIDDTMLSEDPKEAKLKSLYPQEYQYLLKNVYPTLRRSDYEIRFNIRQFTTLEECLEIYRTKPQQLSLYEFWRVAQSFPEYGDDYNRAVQTAHNFYPESPEANVNLANVAIHEGDLLKAETLLSHAGQSAEAENARAVVALMQGRYDEAQRHLDNASKGLDVSKNREALKMLKR